MVDLPDDYAKVLETVDGIEFNGFILYGIDQKWLKNNKIKLFMDWSSITKSGMKMNGKEITSLNNNDGKVSSWDRTEKTHLLIG